MPYALLLLAALVPGCLASRPAAPSGSPVLGTSISPDSLVANVAVIRRAEGGADVVVSFVAPAEVRIAPGRLLRVDVPGGPFEAAFVLGPDVSVQADAVVTTAEYRISEAGAAALDRAGTTARLGIDDGTGVRTVAIRRSDIVE